MSDKVVPGITDDDILSVLEELAPPRQQPGDVTAAMMAEVWDVTAKTALTRLRKGAKAGKLVEIKDTLLDSGVYGSVFRASDT